MRTLLTLLMTPLRLMAGLMRWATRMLGFILLVAAFATLVVDGSRSIANDRFTLTPAGQTWYDVDRESIGLAQAVVQRYTLPYLWDPVIQTILTWPTVAVLGIPGLALWAVSLRRGRRRYRLF